MEYFNRYTHFLSQVNTYVRDTDRNVLDLLKSNCDTHTYQTINQKVELLVNEMIQNDYDHVTQNIDEMLSTPLVQIKQIYRNESTTIQKYSKEVEIPTVKPAKEIILNYESKIVLPNGETREGTFKNGVLNGRGKATYGSSIQEGIFKNDELIEGTTTTNNFISPFTTVREGIFKNNFLTKGKKIIKKYNEKEIYEGKFKNDGLIEGKISYDSGRIDEGVFKNHVLQKGKMILSSGEIREGVFKDNQLIKGKNSLDSNILEGVFKDGQLIKGKSSFDGETREGVFKDGLLVKGKNILPNGEMREGHFEQGNFQKGTIIKPNGQVWKGELKYHFYNHKKDSLCTKIMKWFQ